MRILLALYLMVALLVELACALEFTDSVGRRVIFPPRSSGCSPPARQRRWCWRYWRRRSWWVGRRGCAGSLAAATGKPADILTSQCLSELYDVNVAVERTESGGTIARPILGD